MSALYISHQPPCSVNIGINDWKTHISRPLLKTWAHLEMEDCTSFHPIKGFIEEGKKALWANKLATHISLARSLAGQ